MYWEQAKAGEYVTQVAALIAWLASAAPVLAQLRKKSSCGVSTSDALPVTRPLSIDDTYAAVA
jgi:hypothetical protein